MSDVFSPEMLERLRRGVPLVLGRTGRFRARERVSGQNRKHKLPNRPAPPRPLPRSERDICHSPSNEEEKKSRVALGHSGRVGVPGGCPRRRAG